MNRAEKKAAARLADAPKTHPGPQKRVEFTPALLESMGALATRKNGRLTASDSEVPGLMALARPSGMVSLIIRYAVGATRAAWTIGDFPTMSRPRELHAP